MSPLRFLPTDIGIRITLNSARVEEHFILFVMHYHARHSRIAGVRRRSCGDIGASITMRSRLAFAKQKPPTVSHRRLCFSSARPAPRSKAALGTVTKSATDSARLRRTPGSHQFRHSLPMLSAIVRKPRKVKNNSDASHAVHPPLFGAKLATPIDRRREAMAGTVPGIVADGLWRWRWW